MSAPQGPIHAASGMFRRLSQHPNARLIATGAAMIAFPFASRAFLSLLWNGWVVATSTPVPDWFLYVYRPGTQATSLALIAGVLIGPPLMAIGAMRSLRGKRVVKPPDTRPAPNYFK